MSSQTRRKFLANSAALTAGSLLLPSIKTGPLANPSYPGKGSPIVVSTWDFGRIANLEAWKYLLNGSSSLDAVEKGISVIESDPKNQSVGIGGSPDRDGFVTLDASIMDPRGRAGSVTFLQDIINPVSVARKVMEDTPHVMLSGEGALQFALEKGFKRQNLLTEQSKKDWEKWKETSHYEPVINIENHDTIGMLCIDQKGEMSGGCSTSGLAYKIHGRVGDSPIIGAALYVDNEIGGAVTTGLGELVMRNLSSFLVIELMRNGASVQEACEEAIHRVIRNSPDYMKVQVAVLALDMDGNVGAYAIQPGFSYAVQTSSDSIVIPSNSYLK